MSNHVVAVFTVLGAWSVVSVLTVGALNGVKALVRRS
jgi:hypothetical protein